VDVNIADHSAVISFTNYYKGATPALIVNHTPWLTIGYKQRFVLGCYMLSLISLLTHNTRQKHPTPEDPWLSQHS